MSGVEHLGLFCIEAACCSSLGGCGGEAWASEGDHGGGLDGLRYPDATVMMVDVMCIALHREAHTGDAGELKD